MCSERVLADPRKPGLWVAVVLKLGTSAEPGEIVQFARKHLNFKVPQYLVMCSQTLPRNPGGKLLKKQLRETLDWGKALW